MTGSRFLRGVITVAAAAAVGGAAAGAGGSTAGAPGRIFFSSNRAANLNPELFVVPSTGTARHQLTKPTEWFDQASLSPDGTRVVGRTPHGLELRNPDGTNPVQLTTGGGDVLPRWSPDGSKVAYISGADQGVYVIPASGGAPVRLDSALGWVPPAWSPDGSEVAYVGYADGTPSISLATADGTSTAKVVETGWPTPSTLQWLPDGSIVYDGPGHIYSVASDGSSDPVQLTQTYSASPVVSPDGSRIAYTDYRNGRPELWVMNADGSGQSFLSQDAATYPAASWSPDGAQVAAVYWDGTGTQQIVLVPVDGSHEIDVTLEPRSTVITSAPSWTPDSSSLYFTAYLSNSDRELYSMLSNGKSLQQLTHNNVDDADPAVSPDGRFVAFDRGPAGQQQLFVMGVGGGGCVAGHAQSVRRQRRADVVARRHRARLREQPRRHIPHLPARSRHRARPQGHRRHGCRPPALVVGGRVVDRFHLLALRGDRRGLAGLGRAAEWARAAPRRRGHLGVRAVVVPARRPARLLGRRPAVGHDGGLRPERRRHPPCQRRLRGRDLASGLGSEWQHDRLQRRDGLLLGALGRLCRAAAPVLGRRLDRRALVAVAMPIRGTAGNDVLVGTPGADTICGFGGNDRIDGRGGADVLLGGDGNDTLTGGPGSDLVFGGRGNDVLRGRDGLRDVLDGGPGRDLITGDGRDTKR